MMMMKERVCVNREIMVLYKLFVYEDSEREMDQQCRFMSYWFIGDTQVGEFIYTFLRRMSGGGRKERKS